MFGCTTTFVMGLARWLGWAMLAVGLLCPGRQALSHPCPVEFPANHTSYCECNVLLEVFCYNLEEIPTFVHDEREYMGLYMENQDIAEIKAATFFELKVRKISLSYNPVRDMISNSAFTNLENHLEELHLADCGIRTLPDTLLYGMTRMKVVHFWGNKIEVIPDKFFKGTKNLEELSLWGNKIKRLNANSFAGLWNLKKLDLDNNHIRTLSEEMFRHLGNLEALYLGSNHINTINSDTFKNLVSLKVLKLNNNGLQYTFDFTFRGLNNLQILGLQNNKLNYINDDLINGLHNLSILWLQHNKIDFMWSRNFKNLKKLQEINLSYNNLTHLKERLLRDSPNLTHLFIDHNNITTLQKCSLPKRPRLKIFSLVENPMLCDCLLRWVSDLHRRGTTVWGACLPTHTPAKKLTAVFDELNYNDCSRSKKSTCLKQ